MTSDEKIPHTEIYQADSFEASVPLVEELLKTIYNIGEVYDIEEGGNVQLKAINDCAFYYDGLEHLYTNSTADFMLYFSHEDSVTAGGEKLLAEIHKIWPAYKNHLWIDGNAYKLLNRQQPESN